MLVDFKEGQQSKALEAFLEQRCWRSSRPSIACQTISRRALYPTIPSSSTRQCHRSHDASSLLQVLGNSITGTTYAGASRLRLLSVAHGQPIYLRFICYMVGLQAI